MAQLNFDASKVEPNVGFDTIPAGWYKAIIDESEMRPTKQTDGIRLHLRFMVIEGPYANRKVFCGLNLQNQSQKAVEIALGQLSAIAHAVGVLHVADSNQLHNLPMWIKVKIRKDESGQYEDQNDISSFKNINDPTAIAAAGGVAPNSAAPPQQPIQQSWQTPAGQQPWPQPGAAAAPPPAAAPAGAAPQPWSPPGAAPGTPPWQHQPPAAGPAAAPAAVPQPPHQAQSAPPPWATASSGQPAGTSPPWQQPRQ